MRILSSKDEIKKKLRFLIHEQKIDLLTNLEELQTEREGNCLLDDFLSLIEGYNVSLFEEEVKFIKKVFSHPLFVEEIDFNRLYRSLDLHIPDDLEFPVEMVAEPLKTIVEILDEEIMDRAWFTITRSHPELLLGSDGKPLFIPPNQRMGNRVVVDEPVSVNEEVVCGSEIPTSDGLSLLLSPSQIHIFSNYENGIVKSSPWVDVVGREEVEVVPRCVVEEGGRAVVGVSLPFIENDKEEEEEVNEEDEEKIKLKWYQEVEKGGFSFIMILDGTDSGSINHSVSIPIKNTSSISDLLFFLSSDGMYLCTTSSLPSQTINIYQLPSIINPTKNTDTTPHVILSPTLTIDLDEREMIGLHFFSRERNVPQFDLERKEREVGYLKREVGKKADAMGVSLEEMGLDYTCEEFMDICKEDPVFTLAQEVARDCRVKPQPLLLDTPSQLKSWIDGLCVVLKNGSILVFDLPPGGVAPTVFPTATKSDEEEEKDEDVPENGEMEEDEIIPDPIKLAPSFSTSLLTTILCSSASKQGILALGTEDGRVVVLNMKSNCSLQSIPISLNSCQISSIQLFQEEGVVVCGTRDGRLFFSSAKKDLSSTRKESSSSDTPPLCYSTRFDTDSRSIERLFPLSVRLATSAIPLLLVPYQSGEMAVYDVRTGLLMGRIDLESEGTPDILLFDDSISFVMKSRDGRAVISSISLFTVASLYPCCSDADKRDISFLEWMGDWERMEVTSNNNRPSLFRLKPKTDSLIEVVRNARMASFDDGSREQRVLKGIKKLLS